ncbi:MAG: ChbG/HpnK family deacetylase [Helicobacteraceae bacterium]|jgi:predicted glycoside hydrolase/deacetylase ChbG (UPF0249 family)|nr:ChbG/HpnK family deacetylase [Helicobacteraceae bacterium]
MSKVLIVNADDLGISRSRNAAIEEGYKNGVLTSASLMVNGEYFDEAIDIIRRCGDLSVGVHLNIVEGKALIADSPLADKNGAFKRGFVGILLRSGGKSFQKAVEAEFRAQIELAKSVCRVDHIDSHVHTHAIPPIFKIAAKLANEYQIPFIRTQYESAYITPRINKIFTVKYPVNLVKIALLNLFTKINAKHIPKPLKTNDAVIGVGYTGMMDVDTIKYGVRAAKEGVIEIIAHPDLNSSELDMILDASVKDYAPITSYARLRLEYER